MRWFLREKKSACMNSFTLTGWRETILCKEGKKPAPAASMRWFLRQKKALDQAHFVVSLQKPTHRILPMRSQASHTSREALRISSLYLFFWKKNKLRIHFLCFLKNQEDFNTALFYGSIPSKTKEGLFKSNIWKKKYAKLVSFQKPTHRILPSDTCSFFLRDTRKASQEVCKAFIFSKTKV